MQANIAAAGYATTSLVSSPGLPPIGSIVSFRAMEASGPAQYLSQNLDAVLIRPVSSASSAYLQQRASWHVRTGLGFSGCYSFESVDAPGSFVRQSAFRLRAEFDDGITFFAEDATFCPYVILHSSMPRSISCLFNA